MKRALLLVLGLSLVGGIAYVATNTDILSGNLRMKTDDSNLTDMSGITVKTSELGGAAMDTGKALNTIDNGATDADGDGLVASVETTFNSDPTLADTDAGGIPDGVEYGQKMDPRDPTDDATLMGKSTNAKLACSSVLVDPSSITVTSAEEAAAGVDFTTSIVLQAVDATGAAAKPDASVTWKGTLMITTTGKGTFTDSEGKTGHSLSIPATQDRVSFDLTYTGGASKDLITAYIKEEQGCKDSLTLTVESKDQGTQPTSTMVCSAFNITPDSYELASGESSMNFTVTVKGSSQTSWQDLFKNMMAFTLGTQNTVWGMLDITTSGTGTLSNDKTASTGTSLQIPIFESSTTVKVTYNSPVSGDVLKARIEGQETLCSDSLTLTAAATPVATTSSTVTTTTSTTTTTTDDSLAADAETIIGDSDYDCSDPFTDDSTDLTCRMYQANVINGKSQTRFDPTGNLTIAEAIKIIDLIAGYTANDAYGKTEPFLDVNENDWHYPYVVIATWKDALRERDAGLYLNPNNAIPRAWFVLYATRMAGKTLPAGTWDQSDIPWSDVKTSDPYAYALVLAYNTEVTTPEEGDTRIITGYSDGTFRPHSYITRSEALSIVQRLYLSDWFNQ